MRIAKTVFKLQNLLKEKLQPDKHYLLAVSGGADSLALAHAASELEADGYARFSVCHVEHGLRGEEAWHDMQLVQRFCLQYKLPCYVQHVDVPKLALSEHLSTEDAARRLRYGALRSVAGQLDTAAIVTAHHEGDQAETLLLRLLRGAGLEGLAAMREHSDDILRPLLDVPRSLLEEYCVLNNLHYCHDSTNDDKSYARNRVRLELVPYLEHNFNADIISSLARTAQLLAQDAACLEQMSKQHYEKLALKKDNTISFAAKSFLALPVAIRTRLIRLTYFDLGGKELSYERTMAVDELCSRCVGGKVVQLPQGIIVSYKAKRIIFIKNNIL